MPGALSRSTFKLMLVISIAGAAVIVLAGWLPAHLRAVHLGRQVDAQWRELRQSYGVGRPVETPLEELHQQSVQLQGQLQVLRGAVSFAPDERFRIDPNSPQPGFQYSRVRDQLQTELRERAAKAGLTLPETLDPRGESSTPPDAEAAEMLYRFAMNHRIVEAAIQARLEQVESLKYDLKKPVLPGPAPFVRPVEVEATVLGSTDAVMKLLHELQQPASVESKGRFLHLREAKLTPPDERSAQIKAILTLEALRLDPEGLLPEEMPTLGPRLPLPLRPAGTPVAAPSALPGY